MSVKLIAENILTPADFLSATEQEGAYIGQPAPDSANTGDFRLLSSGDIQDFTYSGTATSDGTTLTIIDSVLAAFGDNYFISGTITFLTGANTSGTKTITDFAQATGTITWVGAVNSTLIGDTFTLTMSFASRDFKVELIASGDAGAASFNWSHDGTTYLGRDAPNQAIWLAETEITANAESDRGIITQASDGELVVLYDSLADNKTYSQRSNDGGKGISWDSPVAVISGTSYNSKAVITLSGGRIVANIDGWVESDDDGKTWSFRTNTVSVDDMVQLKNRNIIAVNGGLNYIRQNISEDDGKTWSSSTALVADINNQMHPTIVQANNGDVVCAYASDEDLAGDYEIKCKISKDGGATWGATIDIIDFVTEDLYYPRLANDANGGLYCVCSRDTADSKLVFAMSSDFGETWGSEFDLKVVAGKDLTKPDIILANGHEMICTYLDITNNNIDLVRRGLWGAGFAFPCPCAIEAQEQKLINDVGLTWHGGGGIAGDKWTFGPEYRYAMSNIIEDSPSKPWRSEQDNIACGIVIDLGANERYWADGIGLFGCNIRTCSYQMNATDSWGSPSVDESISFDLATGTVDVVDGNYVKDTSLLANYKDHELKARGLYLRVTSGTDDTLTWKIKDNVGDYIVLDTTAVTNIAATDTFVIFQGNIAKTFTGGLYRYLRVAIAAQHTADDYYQIGAFVPGKTVTLSKSFSIGYGKDHHYDIDMIRSPHGGLTPIKGADRKRIFTLNFPAVAESGTQAEIAALLDYVEGKNIVLIPDDSDMTDCYLVKHIGDLRQKHRARTYFDVGPVVFEEVL